MKEYLFWIIASVVWFISAAILLDKWERSHQPAPVEVVEQELGICLDCVK